MLMPGLRIVPTSEVDFHTSIRGTSLSRAEKPAKKVLLMNLSVHSYDGRSTHYGSIAPSTHRGYEDAIVVPAITADNFELKHGLLTLVQNKQFFGNDKEDPHARIRYFNKITSTLKFQNVLNMSIKLMLFPFSLEGAARIWLEKEPPRSIFTWDDLVSKFINQFFPPSKTTNLRNEITNFQQRFDESFSEAYDRFKDLLRACPHHGFLESHQLDTFYNALNSKDQDSLNSAAGGNFLDKMPRECLAIIESKSKVRYSRNKPVVAKVSTNTSTSGISPDVAKLKDMVKALLLDKKSQNQAPATVKAVKESSYQASAPQTQGVLKEDFLAYVKANDVVMRNMLTQGQNMQNQLTNLTDLLTKFVNSNNPSTSSSGTLPSNTIANPRSDLKAITTRSEATKDIMHPTNNESTEDVQPLVVQSESPILTSEPVNSPTIEPVISPFGPSIKSLLTNKDKLCELARTPLNEHCSAVLLKKLLDPGKFLIPCDFLRKAECLALVDLGASINLMPFSVWNKLSLLDFSPTCMTLELVDRSISHPFEVAEDVYVKVGTFHFLADFVVIDFDADLRVPLILERSFLTTKRALIDVFEGELTLRVGKEAITFNLDQTSRYSANYNDMTAKRIDVIDMACEEYSDFLLEEVDAFLALEDDPTSSKVDQSYLDSERDILLLEAFLNDDPSLPPPHQGNYLPEVHKELKICDDKLPVIITKDLSVEEKTALITVLKSPKRAIAWKLFDIKDQEKTTFTAHTERLLIIACLLGYAMHQARFRERMLKRCEDTNLCLNWEKSHFMVKDGIVLGHKIYKQRIEVDKAKVDVITKLPYPTTVNGAENLAADHLSRLENPHQNMLDTKEINESFPLETFNLVSTHGNSSTLWFADFANYHAGNFVVKGTSSQQKSKFFTISGTTPFCLKTMLIKSSQGVYMARKPLTFSRLACRSLDHS
nr:hypothetical protein [Tanacetum cinerariifolium]